MLDMLMSDKHAIALLKKDHDEVDALFKAFEKSDSKAEKEKIIQQAINALKMHAIVEEEIFYPTVRKQVGAEIMDEADEEHHVAKLLIAELDQKNGGGDHRFAKFTVLAENIKHHVKEEEDIMMPKAQETKVDFEALGEMILERKQQLMEKGIPVDAEHKLMASAGMGNRGDSPAAAAKRKKPVIRKSTKSSGDESRA
ncbi:MAG TPA: hemerythrin domain-containing protein [Patescibacteria group bacterium]|nr:hemerythrin domain-containing protein [Patescibacteria group bacterium]